MQRKCTFLSVMPSASK